MSMHINKVMFTGRLVRDPQLRMTNAGMPVCNVTLAQTARRKEGDAWVDGDPIFVNVAIWGNRGAAFAKHHLKGDEAYIEGRLRFDMWEDKTTGAKRTQLKVDADEWQFVPRGAPGVAEEKHAADYAAADDTPF